MDAGLHTSSGSFRGRTYSYLLTSLPPSDLFPYFVSAGVLIEGRYGKDRPPRDFNRDWSSNPVHPEIRALIRAIDDAARRHPYRFFVDLHAPAPGDVSFWLPSRLSYGTPRWEESWDFGRRLEHHASGECPVNVEDYTFRALDWSQELYELTSTYFQAFRYGVHSGTLETSYHRHAGGDAITPEGWRGAGRAFLRAMKDHMEGESGPPLGMIEKWGTPPPCLSDWILPATPRGVTITEQSPTRLAFAPDRDENVAWVTCNRFYEIAGAQRHPVTLMFDREGEDIQSRSEVILYAYEGGLPTGDRRHFYLEPGSLAFTWNGEGLPENCDSVRFSIRLTNLTAPVRVAFEP